MKKKVGSILVRLLQLLLFAGAFVVEYFTGKKMGMARHVIFKNQEWEKAFPLEQWTLYSIIALVILLTLALVLLMKKRGHLTRGLVAEGILMVILTLFSLHFTLANSVATLRPYYWMSPMFAAAALLQILRTLALLMRKKA